MEFLSGYAAAKAPYLVYEVEGSHRSRSKPARSNSTSGTGTTKKRSRIPGHARTNSASTSSSGGGRTEHQASPHASTSGFLQQSSGGPDASGASADTSGAAVTSVPGDRADSTSEQHHHRRARRNSHQGRERISSSLKYFQDKQLPATPRLNTDASSKHPGVGSHSEPASARTPASAGVSAAVFGTPGSLVTAVTFPDRRMIQNHPAMFQYTDAGPGKMSGTGGPRAESISSVSGATTTSNRTMQSSEHTSDSTHQLRPFVVRNGRTYLADPTLPYPLPVDLEELHRQSLQTMLLMQLYGRPICAPAFTHKPPPRILEVGCGTGFWSMMCYKYYEARGLHKDMSFTGIDIVPLPPNSSGGGADPSADTRPDKGMNWRFVQHDMRKLPFPFPDNSFDFVMVKDASLTTSMAMQQTLIEEYIRILTPGGTIEIWETDHLLRMLRPHVPECATTSGPEQDDSQQQQDPDDSKPENTGQTTTIGGAYVMTANTPLSTPLNNFLVEYNAWVARALEARALCAMPCTVIGPLLVQEVDVLTGLGSRRLAVPLSEIRWEKEGVGGVVTKDGKSYIESSKVVRKGVGASGKGEGIGLGVGGVASGGGGGGGGLDAAAAALRRTALMIVVGKIQSLEPVLREASGKSQDEWDAWVGKMMNDLVRENGTSWGECLEVGAWWARKR